MREHKWNLFDLLVLLTVGFCIFSGVARRMETRSAAEMNARSATVTLRITGTEAHLPSCVSEGEEVFFASGERFGALESIVALPMRVTAEEDGAFFEGEWTGGEFWDVTAEIRIEGSVSEEIFLQGGSRAVLVGQSLSLYTAHAYLYGTLTDVRVRATE